MTQKDIDRRSTLTTAAAAGVSTSLGTITQTPLAATFQSDAATSSESLKSISHIQSAKPLINKDRAY